MTYVKIRDQGHYKLRADWCLNKENTISFLQGPSISTLRRLVWQSSLMMLVLFTGSCNLPKDPQDSWSIVKKQGLHVGVVENPPFSYFENGGYKGSEVVLLKEFAASEEIAIHFEAGTETALVKRLEGYKIQVLIGGFEKNTVWKERTGLTLRYNGKNVFLVPKGENELLGNLENYLLNRK